jgi:hypothetical protein
MGRGRSTLLLLLVLVALGTYIYFVEWKRPPASESGTEKAKIFTVDSAKVEELRITSSSGETTSLKKENGRWKVTSPVASDADEAEASGITSNLSTLETQRVVDESPKDLAPFGLAPPRVEIAFRATGDKEPRRLLLGAKTPTGGDMYAKLPHEARVFLVSGFLDSTFDRSTFDLRDKAVLKVDRDKVDGLEVRAASQTLGFAKSADAWKMTAPIAARADFGAVEGLLGRIANGQMKSIADAEGSDLKKYGLDKPEYTVTLAAGSARSVFLVGGKTPEGQYFAKDGSRPMVFTVDAFLVEDLSKAPADFRPKDLFEFRTFSGQRFEVTRANVTLVFEKRKGKDDKQPERWVRVQPAKEIEETKIIDALSKVSNLRADTFVDALPAGAAQAAQIKARYADGKKEEVVAFLEAGDEIFATRAGDPGAAKVSSTDFNEAMKALDALR